MQRYNPKEIEPKWQKKWEETGIYRATEDPSKPKRYVLEYFPYPSGAAMHVGHVRNYTIGDAVARFHRMQGENVLHPMGWDAFGLPAENYAIKNNISPQQAIAENTAKFKQQLTQMGFSYDWSREIDSSNPNYYKWTQWFFKLLFERGLAYRKDSLVNWDPVDKTVLANEQVIDGKAERSGAVVEKIPLAQWLFKITDYADRLTADLDKLDWSESIKTMQRNWIGKSSGASVSFAIDGYDKESIEVFTTAHDTIYGVTFMVLAPEHSLVETITTDEHRANVHSYIHATQGKNEIERQDTNRAKTGTFTGAYAINPINGARIPIWIADYVLAGYGTGAVMAVPGEDARDHEFAQKYNLPIIYTTDRQEFVDYQAEVKNHRKDYRLANSSEFDGLDFEEGRKKILEKLVSIGAGSESINYKIRDWLISRQRYWGAPIPMIWVDKTAIADSETEFIKAARKQEQIKLVDGKELIAVPVPDEFLPVTLPEVDSYKPDGSGKGPLARSEDWVHVWMNIETGATIPHSQGKPVEGRWAEGWRETDTMDGFACSSWYFLRFADPHNDTAAFNPEKAKFWLPVDDYIGGAEHAVMHLLYARMWTKVMFDAGLIEFDEPFKALRNQGMILAPDGRKMSKSWGNVIAPDEIIEQGYGADAIRLMELFIGPWDQSANWSVEGMGGTFRFLQRVWTLTQEFLEASGNEGEQKELLPTTHKAIKKVTEDLHHMGFNTAIAALMETTNELYKIKADGGFADKENWKFALNSLIQLLAPFAPHITEELWQQIGNEGSVHISNWPVYDEAYLVSDTMNIVVQVNGKVRANITVAADADQEAIGNAAKAEAKVQEYLQQKEVRKTIYVPRRLINFVV